MRNAKALAKLLALLTLLGLLIWRAESAPDIETTPATDPVPQGMY